MTAQVMTANRLIDGEVVFWQRAVGSSDIAAANVAGEAEQAKALDALGRRRWR